MSDAAPLPSLARSPPLGWIFMARPPVVCPCDTSVKGTLPGFQPVLNRIVESGDLRGLCRPSAAIAGSGQRRRRRSARQRRSIWKKPRSARSRPPHLALWHRLRPIRSRQHARSIAEHHKPAPVALDAGSINRASDRKVIMTVQNFLRLLWRSVGAVRYARAARRP
jgi:hypothetical protein